MRRILYRVTNILWVISSVIEKITYSTLDEILVVHFKNGSAWAYLNVPETTYDLFDVRARNKNNSIGSLYNSKIKGEYESIPAAELDYQPVDYKPYPTFKPGDIVRDTVFGGLAVVQDVLDDGERISVRFQGDEFPNPAWFDADTWEFAK